MNGNVKRGTALVGAMLMLSAVPVLLGAAPLAGQERDPRASRGEQMFISQGCYGCHLIGKFGTPIGPELSRVGAKYEASYLRQWLRDPASVRPTAHMPKLELTPDEIDALAAYLASLK
jgi:cbb3-type cytochrome oxidase cytochrome c subunit